MTPLYFLRTRWLVLVFAEHYESDAAALAAAQWLRLWLDLPVTVVERAWRPFRFSSGAPCDS